MHLYKDENAFSIQGRWGCLEGKRAKNEALIDALANTPLCSAFSACNYFSPKTAIILKKKIALLVASLKMDGDFIKHKWQKAKQQPALLNLIFSCADYSRISLPGTEKCGFL